MKTAKILGKWYVLNLLLVAVFFAVTTFCNDGVYAEDVWFGTGTGSTGSGGGSFDGECKNCYQENPSWIYFEALGAENTSFTFVPRTEGAADGYYGMRNTGGDISPVCSNAGMGFWHYGSTKQAYVSCQAGCSYQYATFGPSYSIDESGTPFNSDSYYNYMAMSSPYFRYIYNGSICGYRPINENNYIACQEDQRVGHVNGHQDEYKTEGGHYGHQYTYNVGFWANGGYPDLKTDILKTDLSHILLKYSCGRVFNGWWYETQCNTKYVYQASRIGTKNDIVRYYNKACAANNYRGCRTVSDYNELPSDLYSFCLRTSDLSSSLVAKSVLEDAVIEDGVVNASSDLSKVAGLEDKTVDADENGRAAVVRGLSDEYAFLGWKMALASNVLSENPYVTEEDTSSEHYVVGEAAFCDNSGCPKESFVVSELKDDFTVYAVYREKASLAGEVKATSGNETYDTAMVQEDTEGKVVFSCDSVEGCDVTFEHSMERLFNSESADYVIKKSDGETETEIKTGTFSPAQNNTAEILMTHTVKLLPGEEACETLTFNLGRFSSDQFVTIKVCVIMTGGLNASLDLKVNNKTLDSPEIESSWKNEVYAKPGDNIQYRLIYAPLPQFAYNVNSGLLGNRWDNTVTLGDIVASSDVFGISNGVTANQTKIVPEDAYQVTGNDVGKALKETAYTRVIKGGDEASSYETPSYAGYEYDISQDDGQWTIETEQLSSTAYVYVPYNYKSYVSVSNWNQMASAGQVVTVGYNVSVKERDNKVTRGTYATKTGMAKSKVILYEEGAQIFDGNDSAGEDGRIIISDDSLNAVCGNSNSRCFAGNGNDDGFSSGEHPGFEVKAEVPDWTAGTGICVAVAFYPASSGADTNYNDKEGDHSWVLAKGSSCTTIGKRPTFQVWGGGLYATGDVVTYATAKSSLDDFSSIPGDGRVIAFSSWVEQLAISQSGTMTQLASGATTGYNVHSVSDETFYGGSMEEWPGSYCKYRVPLSVANDGCFASASGAGKSRVTSGELNANNMIKDINKMKDIDDGGVVKTSLEGADLSSYSGLTIFDISGDVTIDSNIKRDSGARLAAESGVIILANDINIKCGVSRIDAILYAKGDINTCSDAERNADGKVNYDDSKMAKQLVVNGAIYADGTIKFERTYGMATGINSYIPAEIINYDTSVVFWLNRAFAGYGIGSNSYKVVYQNELPPRF